MVPFRSPKISSSYGENNDENEDNEDKDHSFLMYAQKLNNNAAMCIEIGYYEKATQSLQKALEFSQKQSDESLIEVCTCNGCKTDGCIDFAADFKLTKGKDVSRRRHSYCGHEDYPSSDEEDLYVRKKNVSKEKKNKLSHSISHPKLKKMSEEERYRPSHKGKTSWSISDEFCEEEVDRYEDEDETIHKSPIRVVRVGHSMGSSLFLIITFNLALTLHLEVASTHSKKHYNSESAKKALLFYDLASADETRLLSDSGNYWDSSSSIRFNTILKSNLNQLYQYLPEMSLPIAHSLESSVVNAIDEESDRTGGNSSSRNSRWSSETKTMNKSNKGSTSSSSNIMPIPRSRSRAYSESSSSRRMSRSSERLSGGKSQKGKASPLRSAENLQKAQGDISPASNDYYSGSGSDSDPDYF
jgi:hypothetical protein